MIVTKIATNRLKPDPKTHRVYKETIIVIPDEADFQKTERLVKKELISDSRFIPFARKLKVWTLSMLKKHKEEGYFNKKK